MLYRSDIHFSFLSPLLFFPYFTPFFLFCKDSKQALTFSCKPQQYLKSGERRQILTGSGTVYNPTLFDARPLLRIYGTGQVIIGDVTVTVTECDEYTDIDCELEDAYKDSVNKNGCLILSGGEFPVLQPGTTGIIFGAGVTKIELIPRWWCL